MDKPAEATMRIWRGLCSASTFISLTMATGVACAQEGPPRPKLAAIGATGGTLGVGVEASYLVYDTLVVRANASFLSLNLNESLADFGGNSRDYDFDVTGTFVGGLLDWHVAATGFRLTAGFRYVDLKFEDQDTNGKSIGAGNYTAAQVGTVRTTIQNGNSIAPYLGLGYDSTHFNRDGTSFALGIDVGALYVGDSDVKITTDKSVPGLAADIATETRDLKDDLKKYYHFYPVVMVSGKFAF